MRGVVCRVVCFAIAVLLRVFDAVLPFVMCVNVVAKCGLPEKRLLHIRGVATSSGRRGQRQRAKVRGGGGRRGEVESAFRRWC